MYGRPFTKCGPFILGLLFGYFTVHHDKAVMPTKRANLLFVLSLLLAVTVIYAILPEYWYPEQGNTLYNTVYTAIFRTVFAVGIIGMIASLVYREKRLVTPTRSELTVSFQYYRVEQLVHPGQTHLQCLPAPHAHHLRLQLRPLPPDSHHCPRTDGRHPLRGCPQFRRGGCLLRVDRVPHG